jgi:hypothetical protein
MLNVIMLSVVVPDMQPKKSPFENCKFSGNIYIVNIMELSLVSQTVINNFAVSVSY